MKLGRQPRSQGLLSIAKLVKQPSPPSRDEVDKVALSRQLKRQNNLNNCLMMLSLVCTIMIMEVAIRQGSKICMILHIIRKPNSIIDFTTLSKYYPVLNNLTSSYTFFQNFLLFLGPVWK